jgi:hypothetical protein
VVHETPGGASGKRPVRREEPRELKRRSRGRSDDRQEA